MTLHIHRLEGCAPRPLASYLKALGVLRLVSLQADSEARGRWHRERFELITTLDREELERFFLMRYEPSPILSPWNGSQFQSKRDKGIAPIESSLAQRLKPFRLAIQEARKSLASKNKDKDKPGLLAHCKRTWRGPHEAWLDVTFVLNTLGAPSYPVLLGTGGNDGKLDFPNNQMQRLNELFELSTEEGGPRPEAREKLSASLWSTPEPILTKKAAIGMYAPGSAGGVNSSVGFASDSYTNAFDFVLMMEGTLLFRVGLTRQLSGGLYGSLSAPFSVRATASGYPTASEQEDGKDGEQWFPLWSQAMKRIELELLLSEGRASLRRRRATQSADLARSIATLGVDRGVSAFERYTYLERNGLSRFIVPIGRFEVRAEPKSQLIDDLDVREWLSKLRRASADDRAPNQLKTLTLRLEDAILRICAQANDPAQWQHLLRCLDDIERLFVRSASFCKDKRLNPIPPLSEGWVKASADGSAEHRLALTLALSSSPSATSREGRESREGRDGVRRHWLPLRDHDRFATAEGGWAMDPSVVCAARDPLNDLISLLERRVLESAQVGLPRLTLQAHPRASAQFRDLESLLFGEIDLERVLGLARPLMALKRSSQLSDVLNDVLSETNGGEMHCERIGAHDLDVRFALVRLVASPYELAVGDGALGARFDPEVLRRLGAGDLDRALQVSLRRLRSSGLRSPIRHATGESDLARYLLASLAFPLSKYQLMNLAQAHLC